MPKQNPASPQSVLGKIASILDQFTVEKPTRTLAEITAGTNISKTTAFRLLQELTQFGYITQNDKGYRLGLTAFRLGMVAKEQMKLNEILDKILEPVSHATAETVIAATLEQDHMLYLYVIESQNPLRFVAGAGARRTLPFGATGMALLSQLDVDTQKSLLNLPFHHFTSKTITEQGLYLERLQEVKQNNLVVECGEYYDGIMACAIPVQGKIPLTFAVVGPEERVRPIQTLIIEQLQIAAEKFSQVQLEIPSLL